MATALTKLRFVKSLHGKALRRGSTVSGRCCTATWCPGTQRSMPDMFKASSSWTDKQDNSYFSSSIVIRNFSAAIGEKDRAEVARNLRLNVCGAEEAPAAPLDQSCADGCNTLCLQWAASDSSAATVEYEKLPPDLMT